MTKIKKIIVLLLVMIMACSMTLTVYAVEPGSEEVEEVENNIQPTNTPEENSNQIFSDSNSNASPASDSIAQINILGAMPEGFGNSIRYTIARIYEDGSMGTSISGSLYPGMRYIDIVEVSESGLYSFTAEIVDNSFGNEILFYKKFRAELGRQTDVSVHVPEKPEEVSANTRNSFENYVPEPKGAPGTPEEPTATVAPDGTPRPSATVGPADPNATPDPIPKDNTTPWATFKQMLNLNNLITIVVILVLAGTLLFIKYKRGDFKKY